MYNNYSLEVKRIFKDAEKIAIDLNHPYIGTEHLLLSLINNDDKIKKILLKYDLTYDEFLDELLLVVGTSENKKCTCIYTPLLKRVIKTADEISKNKMMEPMHLLEAILEEGEGIAIRIIISMGIDIDKLYDEIKKKHKKGNTKLELYNIGKDMSEINSDDILVGREKELNLIIETLLRKNKNNPLLIGPAGVGKSAIIEELARRIKSGNVPNKLKDKKIVSLEMSSLVAGTKYRGEFEEKLNKVIKEIEENPEIILFIDEIHTMANAGGAEGAINASDILKPYLARGKVKIIGATTTNEYNKFIAKDKALSRRFEIIKINEPTIKETENILSKIRPSFEKHYNIKITEENIKNIVSLTDRYVLDRFNPDKSIDLLDSVCAMKEVESTKEKDISKLKDKLLNIIKKKENMVKKNNFDEALKYRSMEIKLQEKIDKEENTPNKITEKDIKEMLERKNNIPFIENDFENLENYLLDNIIGQNNVVREIINALKQKEEDLPVSILLTGSTGVGKTKTVKEIAKYLDIPLIRLDLSEYNESVSITRLIGASAGYVGYDDENIFEKVRMNPHSIILLDELEKAHPNVINLFLQILDEGYVTNSKGEKIDFKNTYIFMTSNAMINQKIGFMKGKSNYQDSFSKEFLARITAKINYNNITEEMIKEYLDKKGIEDYSLVKDFDYENQGFRGLDKYLKTKKTKVR
ncbi:ATP-dependent Clp protease ATP-binding subunit [bacterium]|nr:ATP-dependent Clp protease ATP-binding subunit [bacterium]